MSCSGDFNEAERNCRDLHWSRNRSLLFRPRVTLFVYHAINFLLCTEPWLPDSNTVGVGGSSGFLLDRAIALCNMLKVLNHLGVSWLGLVGALLVEAVLD